MSNDRLSSESQAVARARWERLARGAVEHADRPTWARRRRRRRRRIWPLVLALLTFLAGVLVGARAYGAESPLTLKVQPPIMIHRGDIKVDARATRHADNRLLAIAWSSDVGTAGESMRELPGEDAPLVTTLWLRDQPAAHYVFVATVINKLGKIAGRAEAEIHTPDEGGAR